jgi:pimeloyl-ACP methyl ester carboxylesterase
MQFRKRYVLLVIVLLAWTGFRNCKLLELRMSDHEISETLLPEHVPYLIIRDTIHGRVIRYLKVGNDSLPKLICLHGSPSSLTAWRTIYTDPGFQRRFQIIAIDRPGYGYSGFGKVETDIENEVSILQVLIDSFTLHKKAILIGSSYGGPVAAQIAMNMPDRFQQLVLLSAAVKPGSEKTYWASYAMIVPVIKNIFPPTLVMSSEEKLNHPRQLSGLVNWDKINMDVLLIHGNKDKLVYYDNAMYARGKLTHARRLTMVTMNGKGHAIIFSRPDFIKKILMQYLDHS